MCGNDVLCRDRQQDAYCCQYKGCKTRKEPNLHRFVSSSFRYRLFAVSVSVSHLIFRLPCLSLLCCMPCARSARPTRIIDSGYDHGRLQAANTFPEQPQLPKRWGGLATKEGQPDTFLDRRLNLASAPVLIVHPLPSPLAWRRLLGIRLFSLPETRVPGGLEDYTKRQRRRVLPIESLPE